MSKNNQILLDEIVKQEYENFAQEVTINRFFEFFACSQILKSSELSYDEIEDGISGESHDGGADAIYLFVNGDLIKGDENIKDKYKKNAEIEFFIIQSKLENSFNEDALLKLARLCSNLFVLDFDPNQYHGRYNEKVISAFELFRETYLALITKTPKLKINFSYASKGVDIHPNVIKQKDDLISDVQKNLPVAEVNFNFIGAEALIQLFQHRPNDVFSLKLSENPLSTTGQVFIALVSLSNYFDFITDENGMLIKHIFESNVRDYQGKTTINGEIQSTLENPDAEDFWWLNNGVTILASYAAAPGGKELVIHDPEIVNGLQTSSEIYRYFTTHFEMLKKDTRDVLVRVIVPESEEARDRIIRATNSQTPIPKASLRATDEVHRQIEEFMKPRNLFYDRRKNFYKNEGKKPKDIISVPFMSQCLISVLMQKPDYARARPSTLLDDDDSYEKLFHKNNDLITYYLVSSLGRRIELVLKSNGDYSIAEINDIKFYVLYSVAVRLTQNVYPSNAAIAKLKEDMLLDEVIEHSIVSVFDLYKRLGGNEKVAKGIQFSSALKDQLREEVAK
ncbi:AIPR family protein [Oxalicibacterium solurbis]|uniref:Abortive phage infection protein C-terminal domain-containing protein n=1 Tax=Oxalicibacterium solurbis TaxID=69280 RepID=A0A8J3AXI1_9BURK|nr:AIPR family protein [Oxalicibacterium solurbis]GGI53966.1 hypothetical protein GCM10011430_11400 [Oxalicibacterium solurbis]